MKNVLLKSRWKTLNTSGRQIGISFMFFLAISFGSVNAHAGSWDDLAPIRSAANGISGVVGAIGGISSAGNWLSCRTGGVCPPSDAYLAASQAIASIESTLIQISIVNSTHSRLNALYMETKGDFNSTIPLPAAEVAQLMNNARGLFWDTKTYLDAANTQDQQYVKGAYAISVEFNAIAAMYQTIVATILGMGQFPVGMDAVSVIRTATQETNYNLIGSKEVYYTCPANPNNLNKVNTQQSFKTPSFRKK